MKFKGCDFFNVLTLITGQCFRAVFQQMCLQTNALKSTSSDSFSIFNWKVFSCHSLKRYFLEQSRGAHSISGGFMSGEHVTRVGGQMFQSCTWTANLFYFGRGRYTPRFYFVLSCVLSPETESSALPRLPAIRWRAPSAQCGLAVQTVICKLIRGLKKKEKRKVVLWDHMGFKGTFWCLFNQLVILQTGRRECSLPVSSICKKTR